VLAEARSYGVSSVRVNHVIEHSDRRLPTVKAKTRVLILCCNRLLRESIARILSKKTDFEIVAVQAISHPNSDQIGGSSADVLVLDSLDFFVENSTWSSQPPDLGGPPKCVLIAMEDDHSRFLAAVRRGAQAYVLQEASAADVVSAIRAVAEGEAVCPPGYARVLFDFVAQQSDQLPNRRKREEWGLTRREQQLIPLIGQGLSNKEIANSLNLSEQTVKNHIHRILKKVGVSDRLSVLEACQRDLLH
jgi:two-component system, NarL family, response regulator DevR